MTEPQKVDVDELDYDYDGYLTLYGDEPFTGQAVEKDGSGNIVDLATYERGVEHGIQKSWYPNGQIKSEGSTESGTARGVWRKWHANGRIAEETEFDEAGNRMYTRSWNAEGELTGDKVFHERLRPLPNQETDG
ncbi:hypothetical protein ABZ512_17860 [Nocardiopsis dassonvillei]|uniref:toxin-antitoxin system YwqK family antitoxin n=1 Tax=Nocardiopsis dassonvillei TaxID=2014 RepID=UPI0033E47CEF